MGPMFLVQTHAASVSRVASSPAGVSAVHTMIQSYKLSNRLVQWLQPSIKDRFRPVRLAHALSGLDTGMSSRAQIS